MLLYQYSSVAAYEAAMEGLNAVANDGDLMNVVNLTEKYQNTKI
jgi:hypothetical protein